MGGEGGDLVALSPQGSKRESEKTWEGVKETERENREVEREKGRRWGRAETAKMREEEGGRVAKEEKGEERREKEKKMKIEGIET